MFSWLQKLFSFWRHLLPNETFKIVNVSGEAVHKNILVTFQVAGKSTFNTDKPANLLEELLLLKGFSKEDSRLICELAISEKLSPAYKITQVLFEKGLVQFEITEMSSKCVFTMEPEEILASEEFGHKFSPNDLKMLYYQCLQNQESKTKAVLNKSKDNKKPQFTIIRNIES